jgi:hypothetical protein
MLLTDGFPTVLIIGNSSTAPAGVNTVSTSWTANVTAAIAGLIGGLSLLPDGLLYYRCREVQPPDLDQGGPIDVTAMNNIGVRTKVHKHLTSIGVITAHVEYDPIDYASLLPPTPDIGTNLLMAVLFPDLQYLSFWGWIDKFTPTSHKDGELPTAELKIEVSNLSSSGNEIKPFMSNASGGPLGTLGVILP